jgi:DNA-binding MarR family transcriptional regulator
MAEANLPSDLINLTEAARVLGMSRPAVSRLVNERKLLKTYLDPLDSRAKLVSRADVRALLVRENKAA